MSFLPQIDVRLKSSVLIRRDLQNSGSELGLTWLAVCVEIDILALPNRQTCKMRSEMWPGKPSKKSPGVRVATREFALAKGLGFHAFSPHLVPLSAQLGSERSSNFRCVAPGSLYLPWYAVSILPRCGRAVARLGPGHGTACGPCPGPVGAFPGPSQLGTWLMQAPGPGSARLAPCLARPFSFSSWPGLRLWARPIT